MKNFTPLLAILGIILFSCNEQIDSNESIEIEPIEESIHFYEKLYVSYKQNNQQINIDFKKIGSQESGFGVNPVKDTDSVNLIYSKGWMDDQSKISFIFNFIKLKNEVTNIGNSDPDFSKEVFFNLLEEIQTGKIKFKNDYLIKGIDNGMIIKGFNGIKNEFFSSNIDHFNYKNPKISNSTYENDYFIIETIENINPLVYLIKGKFQSTIYYETSNTFNKITDGEFCIPLNY